MKVLDILKNLNESSVPEYAGKSENIDGIVTVYGENIPDLQFSGDYKLIEKLKSTSKGKQYHITAKNFSAILNIDDKLFREYMKKHFYTSKNIHDGISALFFYKEKGKRNTRYIYTGDKSGRSSYYRYDKKFYPSEVSL